MSEMIKQWEKEQHERHWDCYVTMKQWLLNRNEGKYIAEYFDGCPYKSAAIYGAGDLGKLLIYELKDANIEIKYFIDRSAQGRVEEHEIPIYLCEQVNNLESVDVIIVTPINDYIQVTRELIHQEIDIPTISLRDIIFEM